MSETMVIKTLEELKAFLNDKGVLEIAIRGRNKRFKTFQKVMISNLSETQEEGLAQKVIQALNEYTAQSEKNLNLLSSVAKLDQIGILLNGLNLCATCAGFAIVYAKLNAMSAAITQQLFQLQKTIQQTQDIHNEYEFNKVLADHTDMLDCQRKQQPYTEDKMRDLLDREYNVLTLLISTFQKDISEDQGALIFSIFSMLAMFTVSLRSFDELYYYNNYQRLGEKGAWHGSHEKWMGAYDTLTSKPFIEKLQDYGAFKTKLSTQGIDIYYISLLDQVADLRSEIEDNRELIIAIGDPELFKQFKEMSAKEIADCIETAFREAGSDLDEEAVEAAYQKAMMQAAMV